MLTSCNKNSKSGIIEQAVYIGENKNIINTFYIYDFVDSSVIKEHSQGSLHYPGSETYNYYFSHNSNIPNQELMNAKNFPEAKKIIRDYSLSIKYASKKGAESRARFVNCFEFPNDTICNKE
tara:strand:- start:72 stop:437 length:366 start_codon:yes stop_codon:yes gene_type:complete